MVLGTVVPPSLERSGWQDEAGVDSSMIVPIVAALSTAPLSRNYRRVQFLILATYWIAIALLAASIWAATSAEPS